MPSLQEGFGLPYLEAAALEKPLLARALPDVSANLKALGCALPGTYNKLPVAPGSFDAAKESIRLAGRWALLRPNLPDELRMDPEPIQAVEGADFGCLSLEAQMEVLQSSARLPGSLPEPQVPFWPSGSRRDHWADRFFQAPACPALPSGESLMPEVRRRFHYWQQHPLLWP